MMQNSESRKKFNEQFKNWELSGLSRRDFCKRNGFAYSWFMYHQKKMRKENQPRGFEQIRPVVSENKFSSPIEFHYPDGRYFVFSSGTAVSLIKALTN